MITPELIGYIRGEFTKGKTREEIHKELINQGGWTEEDINEAFRTVIPLQGFPQNTSFTKTRSKSSLHNIVFLVIAVLIVIGWWFYRPQISAFFGQISMPSFSLPSFDSLKKMVGMGEETETIPAAADNTPSAPKPAGVKNCGTGVAPNIKDPKTYQNDAVLSCLGGEARICEGGANAVLKDPLFPTIVQITKQGDACNFRLSYAADSTLVDVAGNRLAGQYISCPLNIVKAIDESKKPPVFVTPSIDESSKYAAQIYFYGTLGVFMENDVDKAKIEEEGCSGPFVNSVVASYQKLKAKQ